MADDLFTVAASRPISTPVVEPIPKPVAKVETEPVNCGRCAHLMANRGTDGICGCPSYRAEMNDPNPPVKLNHTCAYARISAKFDPNWKERFVQILQTGKFPDYESH